MRKRVHLLSAVRHGSALTLAQREVSTKTNETGEFCNLLAWLDLAGAVMTFDALHTVKAQASWLTEANGAHYIAIVKRGQKHLWRQLGDLPWAQMPAAHTVSEAGHGRCESRSINTCGIDPAAGNSLFPDAVTAIRLHRQASGRKQSRTTVYAVTSLDAHLADPDDLAALIRGHRTIGNRSHLVRDTVFRERERSPCLMILVATQRISNSKGFACLFFLNPAPTREPGRCGRSVPSSISVRGLPSRFEPPFPP
jgi:predicted transposase YbfD/YdcC